MGLLVFAFCLGTTAGAQDRGAEVAQKLQGFDQFMEKVLKDWNAPGVAVGVVADGKLVFAKGYGYCDYGKKLPFTTQTLFLIASNTRSRITSASTTTRPTALYRSG